MKKQIFISLVSILFFTVAAAAQSNLSGNWEWKSKMDKSKRQTYFSIEIKPKNGKVSGTLFFNELENGETESDGGITAYIGTIKGDTLFIEFDENALEPGYTENLRYKKPKGKAASTATLTLKNGKLLWTQTRGTLGEGMPKQFTLQRANNMKN